MSSLALVLAGCGSSNPAAPSTVTSAAAPAQPAPAPAATPASAPPASVSAVLPASLPPSPTPQTLLVSGVNFKPGLSVDLTFTPAGGGATPSRSRTKTVDPSAIQNLTDTSFQLVVTVTDAGSYSLRVTNPSAPPSDPVTVVAQQEQSTRPTIVGLSPSSPTQSPDPQPVYVIGTNFDPAQTVQLSKPDGTVVTIDPSAITFGSPTAFRMAVVLAATGTYQLRVTNAAGQTSEPWSFTVKSADVPEPEIDGISPKTPTVSSSAQLILVGGDHFAAGLTAAVTNPDGSVTPIGGAAIQNVTTTGFQMTLVLGVVGDYSLQVTNPSGKTSNVWHFSVKAVEVPTAPVITGTSPASPTQSPLPQGVYVGGTSFQTGLTVVVSAPDGTNTTLDSSAVQFGSPTVFKMTVTLAAVGTYRVQVTNPNGLASNSWPFTVTAPEPEEPPAIDGISPSSPTVYPNPQLIGVGGERFKTGLTVTLTLPDGTSSVLNASQVQVLSSTAIKLSITLATAGTYALKVTNPSSLSSNTFSFQVRTPEVPQPPTVTGISPSSPTANAAPQGVYVAGTNFQSGLTVVLTLPDSTTQTIGGTAIQFGSSTVFKLTVTLATAGAYSLHVVNPSGLASNEFGFTVKAPEPPQPPVITNTVWAKDGQSLYILGTGFQEDLAVVITRPNGTKFSVDPSAILFGTSTGINVKVSLDPGTYSVHMTNPNGLSSNEWSFVK